MAIGHQSQLRLLQKMAESRRIPHALIFCGQNKIGKKKVAFEFISLLFRTDVQKSVHPDFILIEPRDKEIQISQVREMNSRLALRNFSAPFKAALIDNADLMNKESQNCLLKTLEEPKGNAVMILITGRPKSLLPTIISRCQTIRFGRVEDSEIVNYLQKEGAPKEMAEEIGRISQGRAGLALDFWREPQKLENYKKIITSLIKTFNSDIAFRFQYAKVLSENPQEILEIWLAELRNVLISKINGREEANFENFSLAKLRNCLNSIQRFIFLILTQNINRRLAIENLLLEL